VYWDGGPEAIEYFMAHHLKECPKNVICNALQLRTIEFEDSDGDGDQSPTYRFKSVSPKKRLTRSRNHGSANPTAVISKKRNPLRVGM
jgi:hypothetical protein